jgi:hypothetical protein
MNFYWPYTKGLQPSKVHEPLVAAVVVTCFIFMVPIAMIAEAFKPRKKR